MLMKKKKITGAAKKSKMIILWEGKNGYSPTHQPCGQIIPEDCMANNSGPNFIAKMWGT